MRLCLRQRLGRSKRPNGVIPSRAPGTTNAVETSKSKFRQGDQVLVKRDNPMGNPRTPMYIRGKKGVVVDVHGVISNPHDHRGLYPPLYTVAFDVA
ncbi:nitrile hydratase subunit beta, partial [bacterium]